MKGTVTGEATIGEAFDTTFEIVSAGLEGYLGGKFGGKAKKVNGKVGKVNGKAGKVNSKHMNHIDCKRSLPEEPTKDIFEKFPTSFKELGPLTLIAPGFW